MKLFRYFCCGNINHAIYSVAPDFTNRTKDNTKLFSFAGKIFDAKCIEVYDGDTITVIFYFNDDFYRFKIRLLGINAPEMKSDNNSKAILARDFLRQCILNKNIRLECGGFEKYGRILGTIWLGSLNINNEMIRNGYAIVYDGK